MLDLGFVSIYVTSYDVNLNLFNCKVKENIDLVNALIIDGGRNKATSSKTGQSERYAIFHPKKK